MYSGDLAQCRNHLGKTQVELARLLGVSPKAVQSFEQGWRTIPAHIERQLLFLLYLKRRPLEGVAPCWEQRSCPSEIREGCIAWQVHAGDLCWFISGTMCEGEFQGSWEEKMRHCRECGVFGSLVPPID